MEAIILAAGRATRMAPLCTVTPKPCLLVAGRSLLWRLLDGLQSAGVERAVVVVAPGAKALREHASAWRGAMAVDFAVQRSAKGTGDAVAAGATKVKGDALVVMGDAVLTDDILGRLMAAKGFAVAVAKVQDASRYGRITRRGAHVKGVAEKAKGGSAWVNTGLYRVPRAALRAAARLKPSPRGELEFTDVLAAWAKRGALGALETSGWRDVGQPVDLLAVHHELMRPSLDFLLDGQVVGGTGVVEDGVVIEGRLYVEEGARVRAGTVIEGDVHVGRGAVVGPHAYLRGPVAIGALAKVGASSEVKASILLAGAHAPHLNYVGDSILGEGCNLGAGTITANLRHDGQEVLLAGPKGREASGRRKLGAIVGDGAKTGIHTSLLPGAVLEAGAWTAAGSVVGGRVAPR